MALSPQYSWPEPDNSSLVKNGAQDIRALGDAIDTSVWNVGFGQAAKNKFINGDFSINQRNFTSTTTGLAFGFDRWQLSIGASTTGTTTMSTQAFTAGSAPVAGYEAANYLRLVTIGQTTPDTLSLFRQAIEDVRTLAGRTVTISFWAKAATGTPKISASVAQRFGSGGSPSASVEAPVGAVTISTSWTRYSLTYAVPSISGKTVGTTANTSDTRIQFFVSAGSDNAVNASSIGIQSNTFDIWGVQVEYGSKATPFQTASGGSPEAELAMCQRYYYQIGFDTTTVNILVRQFNNGSSAGSVTIPIPHPVVMRATPTLVSWGDIGDAANKAFDTVISQYARGGCAIMSSVGAGAYVDMNYVSASAEL